MKTAFGDSVNGIIGKHEPLTKYYGNRMQLH